MIEIRSFEGSAEELAAFTTRVWRRNYEGRMITPLWSKEHFERDLLVDGRDRDLLIAAYDGTRLVGSHPAKSLGIRLHGRQMAATWASFLSVDPDYRLEGVALKLQAEYVKRHRERELPINFGYLYVRSSKSLGPEFWRRQPGSVQVVAKIGTWSRPLDHAAIAGFELERREALGAQAMSYVQEPMRAPSEAGDVRAYRSADLDDCLDLLNVEGRDSDLAYLWDIDVASRQFEYPGLSKTIVMEREGRVAGFVNFTLLDVLGRYAVRVARIDAVAFGDLKWRQRRRLMDEALSHMHADGAKGALMVRGSWNHWQDLVAAGFVPSPAEFYYVAMTTREGIELDNVRRLNVVWR